MACREFELGKVELYFLLNRAAFLTALACLHYTKRILYYTQFVSQFTRSLGDECAGQVAAFFVVSLFRCVLQVPRMTCLVFT